MLHERKVQPTIIDEYATELLSTHDETGDCRRQRAILMNQAERLPHLQPTRALVIIPLYSVHWFLRI